MFMAFSDGTELTFLEFWLSSICRYNEIYVQMKYESHFKLKDTWEIVWLLSIRLWTWVMTTSIKGLLKGGNKNIIYIPTPSGPPQIKLGETIYSRGCSGPAMEGGCWMVWVRTSYWQSVRPWHHLQGSCPACETWGSRRRSRRLPRHPAAPAMGRPGRTFPAYSPLPCAPIHIWKQLNITASSSNPIQNTGIIN